MKLTCVLKLLVPLVKNPDSKLNTYLAYILVQKVDEKVVSGQTWLISEAFHFPSKIE